MSRTYRQACGVAHALDLLGERWTLLVIRDLCAGPTSFSQLARSLAGIGPNLLSARLDSLQQRGLVRPDPSGYALTPNGQALRPLLRTLMAAGHLLVPGAGTQDRPVPARTAMSVLFDAEVAEELVLSVEVRVASEHFSCFVHGGCLQVTDGAPPLPADVVLEATEAGFNRAGSGQPSGDEFRLRGDADALRRFRQVFSLPTAGPQRIAARWASRSD